MKDDIEKDGLEAESLQNWASKGQMEQRLVVGMSGTPELRKEEKSYYLGEFKERVLKVLTREQVAQPFIYPEIEESLKDVRAKRLLLDGELNYDFIKKYIKLAQQLKKPYTLKNDPQLKEEIGLAIVSEEAVEVDSIHVLIRDKE